VCSVKPRPTVELELGGERHAVGLLQIRVLRLLELFGSKSAMADYVGVPPALPGKWARGDTPTGATAALLIDLSFVWERATEDQSDEVVRTWLSTPNRFVGERPLEAVRRGRVAAVIAAWHANMEGSFG
jgi:DNA-binding transcriptional regulator YdaS (Cro superfamily)